MTLACVILFPAACSESSKVEFLFNFNVYCQAWITQSLVSSFNAMNSISKVFLSNLCVSSSKTIFTHEMRFKHELPRLDEATPAVIKSEELDFFPKRISTCACVSLQYHKYSIKHKIKLKRRK